MVEIKICDSCNKYIRIETRAGVKQAEKFIVCPSCGNSHDMSMPRSKYTSAIAFEEARTVL